MRRVILSAAFAISTLTTCIYLQQPAHAGDLEDEMMSDSMDAEIMADINHREEMCAITHSSDWCDAPAPVRRAPVQTQQNRFNSCINAAMQQQGKPINSAEVVCMYVEKKWFNRAAIVNHCVANAMVLTQWPDEKVRPTCERYYDGRVVIR